MNKKQCIKSKDDCSRKNLKHLSTSNDAIRAVERHYENFYSN